MLTFNLVLLFECNSTYLKSLYIYIYIYTYAHNNTLQLTVFGFVLIICYDIYIFLWQHCCKLFDIEIDIRFSILGLLCFCYLRLHLLVIVWRASTFVALWTNCCLVSNCGSIHPRNWWFFSGVSCITAQNSKWWPLLLQLTVALLVLRTQYCQITAKRMKS